VYQTGDLGAEAAENLPSALVAATRAAGIGFASSITAGGDCAAAILQQQQGGGSTGAAVTWGEVYTGADKGSPVPAQVLNSPVAQLAAGESHVVALLADGSVASWGVMQVQTSIAGPRARYRPLNASLVVPPRVQRAAMASVAAGSGYSLALARGTGQLLAWGSVPCLGSSGEGLEIAPADIAMISAGHDHFLALTAGGAVTAYGCNNYSQLDVPTFSGESAGGSQASDGNSSAVAVAVAVAAGRQFSLLLTVNGWVIAWGRNEQGETSVPGDIQGHVAAVAAGGNHALALLRNGSVVGWGSNALGQARAPDDLVLAALSGNSSSNGGAGGGGRKGRGVLAIAAGSRFSLAIVDPASLPALNTSSPPPPVVPVPGRQLGRASLAKHWNIWRSACSSDVHVTRRVAAWHCLGIALCKGAGSIMLKCLQASQVSHLTAS
jgi:hypothetical protein